MSTCNENRSEEGNRCCRKSSKLCIDKPKSVHLRNIDKFFQKRPEMLKRIEDGGSVKLLVSCLDKKYDVVFIKNETFAILHISAPKTFNIFRGYAGFDTLKIVGKTKLNPEDKLTPSVGAGVAIDRAHAAGMSHFYSMINDSVLTAKNVRRETHNFIVRSVPGFPPKKEMT